MEDVFIAKGDDNSAVPMAIVRTDKDNPNPRRRYLVPAVVEVTWLDGRWVICEQPKLPPIKGTTYSNEGDINDDMDDLTDTARRHFAGCLDPSENPDGKSAD